MVITTRYVRYGTCLCCLSIGGSAKLDPGKLDPGKLDPGKLTECTRVPTRKISSYI